ncbi:MAG: type VI secretion system tip protein TssI/VgrG [Polyangiales bacterium]
MTQGTLPETTFSFAAGAVPSEAWTVVRFISREAMSSLGELTVVLAMEPGGPSLGGLLGAPASLAVERGAVARRLQGIVREVEELGSTAAHRFVRVVVVPSLWALSQRSDCRIFQQMNVLAIVREVLRVAGVYQGEGAFEADATLAAMPPREYCVQYQETDLAFVQRLLEEEGIPYYFRHDATGGEALVLAGDTHAFDEVPTLDGESVRVLDAGDATESAESVRWFDERHSLRPTSVTVRDFDFSRPRTPLSPSHPAQPGQRALYEFPARAALSGYDEGARAYQVENTTRLARVRQEAHQMRAHVGRGRSNVTGMIPGRVFELEGHESPEVNRAFLVTAVESVGQAWSELPEDVRASERVLDALAEAGVTEGGGRRGRVERYRNTFETHRAGEIETSVPYRPERTTPRPVVEGPQTAWVVGPAGEEIHTDPHGRIKVQFHWDRQGASDERSSCWIRVAQSSSGPGWGFTVLPRIGMEVVVSFLEGDPDRPMVTACVNNGENGTSYPLPEMKTKSVIKTQSSPKTGGYNEIRFEDKAGVEQMYVQAERDHDTLVKNDQTVTVKRHRTKVVQGDEHNTIEQNRVTHVQMDNVRHVDGNQEVEVHGAVGATLSVDQNREVRVGGEQRVSIDKDLHRVVGGNSIARFAKDYMRTVMQNQIVNVLQNHIRNVAGNDHAVVTGAKFVQANSVLEHVATTVKAVAGQMFRWEVPAPKKKEEAGKADEGQDANAGTYTGMVDDHWKTTTTSGASVLLDGKKITLDAGASVVLVEQLTPPATSAVRSITLDTGAGAKIVLENGKITIEADEVRLLGKKGAVLQADAGDMLIVGKEKVKINP